MCLKTWGHVLHSQLRVLSEKKNRAMPQFSNGPSGTRSGARGAAGAPREFRQFSSSCLKEKARSPPQITPFFRSFAFFFLGPGGRQKSDFTQLKKVEAAPLAENLAKNTKRSGTSPRSASCEQENLARA